MTDLPERIAVFPLIGVLLLPEEHLPLNIFEPRYREMTRDALAGDGLIGMIQPLDPEDQAFEPAIYPTGCVGRITSSRQTQDGRYLIVLTGVSRFRVARELERDTLYRQIVADWTPFADDLDVDGDEDSDEAADSVDRERLVLALKGYAALYQLSLDWSAVAEAPSRTLVNQLSMLAPLPPSEKQALLDSRDVTERARVLTALIEMALIGRFGGDNSASAH